MCSMQPNSPVKDEEILYRSVRNSEITYDQDSCKYRISSAAFNDKNMQTSVDRAVFKNNDPAQSRLSATDSVISLKTIAVRNEKVEKASISYALDVKAAPLEDNTAHAVIVPAPDYLNSGAFKKVKESLARLAAVELYSSNEN